MDFLDGKWALVEQIHAHLIADVPRVEVLDPTLHFLLGQLLGFGDQRRRDTRFGDAGLPEFERRLVVFSSCLGDLTNLGHGDAEPPLIGHAKPGHAFYILWIRFRLEFLEYLIYGGRHQR